MLDTKTTLKPPFRADHVGSLLRPEPLVKAREKGITGPELAEIQAAAIRELIALQENVGLKAVTDGEAPRRYWHHDFMQGFAGFELADAEAPKFKDVELPPDAPSITGKLDFPANHPMLQQFKFIKENTNVFPKFTIPGPSVMHIGVEDHLNFHKPYTDDPELFYADIAAAYKKAVQAFYEAGCRYLQLDDIIFAFLGDPAHRERLKVTRNLDADVLVDRYSWMLEEAIKDRPEDMTIAMHMCRGNFRSSYAASGGYDISADAVFNRTSVDIYFMEYDSDRAGTLEPLKLLPKGNKRVMAGFITTKSPELETPDYLQKKFEEASKYADMDQLGIAPQCGFASTHHGNLVTPDDQKRKLELVVKTAETLWGEV